MTIPIERTRAVIYTQLFLFDLLDPQKTPKVPGDIRKRALRCLRHYPFKSDMLRASKKLPDVFGEPDSELM